MEMIDNRSQKKQRRRNFLRPNLVVEPLCLIFQAEKIKITISKNFQKRVENFVKLKKCSNLPPLVRKGTSHGVGNQVSHSASSGRRSTKLKMEMKMIHLKPHVPYHSYI